MLEHPAEKVWTVIVNWNGWKDTLECVESCAALQHMDRIIVVDNGSEDSSMEKITSAFPLLNIIKKQTNVGYAKACNEGIEYAMQYGAEYIWLLNNDTVVHPSALLELIRVAEASPNIGLVGSKILCFDAPETLHFAGGHVDIETGQTSHVGIWERDSGQHDEISQTDYITGCSLLAKRKVVETIGLLPEDYFLYFEDTDWCMKARNAGFNLYYAPKSKVYHKISASLKEFAGMKTYYLVRNRLYFLQKFGRNVNWSCRFRQDLRHIRKLLRKAELDEVRMVIQGYLDWLRNISGPKLSQRKPG